jgi:hypothetical protein
LSDLPSTSRAAFPHDNIADKMYQPHVEFMEELQKVYDPKTDTILYFHYWAGKRQEAGYLVTHDGVVKKRFGFGDEQHDPLKAPQRTGTIR